MNTRFTINLTPEQPSETRKVTGNDNRVIELLEGKQLEDRIAPAWKGFTPAPLLAR
jgi:hypothetical protein